MKKINKKQKIVLWAVFFLLILAVLFPPFVSESGKHKEHYSIFSTAQFRSIDPMRWIGQIMIVPLIGSGLFLALRSKENELESETDKKLSEGKRQNVINLKRGFKRLTLVLAIIVGIASAVFAVAIAHEEYEQSHFKLPDGFVLDKPVSSFGTTDEIVLTEADFLNELERKYGPSPELDELRRRYIDRHKPIKLSDIPLQPFSTMDLVGLCVLAGLGWGVAGFSAIWSMYLIVWLLCMFIKWLVLGFRNDTD